MHYTHRNRHAPCHPAGESRKSPLRVDFDRRLKLEFHGSKITSDGGFLAYRELDDALGLTEVAGSLFQDSRTGKNGRHGMVGQFRQSVFGRLGGYDDVNDADRLGRDPAMRWIVGGVLLNDGGQATTMVDQSTRTRLTELRRQRREIDKEIKQHTSKSRMAIYMDNWKTVSNLKNDFIKQLKAHPDIGKMSWQRFVASDDYFIYALHTGTLYTHKSVDRNDAWIGDAITKGHTEAELIENATRMRQARWMRDERKRSKKRKASRKGTISKTKTDKKSPSSSLRDRGVGTVPENLEPDR